MAHSNQVREFLITERGIKLIPAYLGPEGVLTGSARLIQEQREADERQAAEEDAVRRQLAFEHRKKTIEAQILALNAEMLAQEEEHSRSLAIHQSKAKKFADDRIAMATSRRANNHSANPKPSRK